MDLRLFFYAITVRLCAGGIIGLRLPNRSQIYNKKFIVLLLLNRVTSARTMAEACTNTNCISRFYQAFVLKESNPTLDWLSVAVRTGYNDYQHLVKDFKEFSGSTPNVLMQQSLNSPSNMFPSTSDFRGV